MSENPNYTIRPYTPADPAPLAVMWNESDDQWPGTFTRGVPLTGERVREWIEKKTALMRLVVENGTDGSIVGYGSLRQRVRLTDWGADGGHLFFNNDVMLAPHGDHELVAYLALAGSLDEAKRYRCLTTL